MTFKTSATIALGFVLLAAATGASQAAGSPYLPYTGHGGLDIVTDVAMSSDPVTTGTVQPGCSIYLPYTGHGGLDIIEGCDPITTGSIEPVDSDELKAAE